MTRIAENQLARSVLNDITENRQRYTKYSNELSSGYAVVDPGDSRFSSTISQYRELLARIEGHQGRVNAVQGFLSFQDNVMSQVNELLVRAKELAAQAVNETNGQNIRDQMAQEIFEIRDHLVSLANSKYQDKYVYGGLDDDDPPFDEVGTFATPATGAASKVIRYDDITLEPGGGLTRAVNVTDDVSVVVNTTGNSLFDNSIQALEKLGRALAGYTTSLDPVTKLPDGTERAYNLPTEVGLQTQAIADSINLLEAARQNDIMPERVSLGARMRRLETASSLLDLTKNDAEEVLGNLQNVDYATAATNLSQAETALQASYTVSQKVLNMSVLDYL